MPNWTYNTIKCSENIFNLLVDDEGKVDFNRVIPMPKSLDIECGGDQDEAIAFYLTNRLTIDEKDCKLSDYISNMFNKNWAETIVGRLKDKINVYTPDEWNELYDKGKQYIYNYKNYGFYDWYGWRNKHWGTKWNACDDYANKYDLTITFNTAWCYPAGIFAEICKRFPNDHFAVWAEYEDGYDVKCVNENGHLIEVEEVEWRWEENELGECYRYVLVNGEKVDENDYVRSEL